MNLSPRTHYEALVVAGRLEADPAQSAVIDRLRALARQLEDYSPPRRHNGFARFIGVRAAEPPRGLYIFGPVGRGKTLLMDIFFETALVKLKRRVHFHAFMADVHERIHHWRALHKAGRASGDDPIAPVAADLAAEAWLLCFDEFSVNDIADAMILGRLFAQLFAHGVVVVATSNVAPDDLYKDGLNRALFVPFIHLLEEYMDVMRLDARTDFRLEKLAGLPVWYVPADAVADAALDDAWRRLAGGHDGTAQELPLKGRSVHVPRAFMGVARFSFHDLCEAPLAAADYLRLAHEYHTIILDHVPVMTYDTRNAAKRFIILIDTFYDINVKLIASAAAEPDALYQADEGFEVQEFKRTASRLIEMRSQAYLARPHGAPHAQSSGSSDGIVET